MERVLYISYDGLTDQLGQSQVLPYLTGLSADGYDITILSFEKRNRLQKERSLIEGIVGRAGIRWVHLPFTRRPALVSKIYDRVRLRIASQRLYQRHRFDLVHCRSYVAAEAGLRLKARYGVRFLFDMRGFWADERVDSGQWNLTNPIHRYLYNRFKIKEKQYLLGADAIISLTEAAKKELLKKQEYAALTIDVIPCCADLRHFDYGAVSEAERTRLREELKILPGEKVVVYLGSLGGWYMTKEMFAFFQALESRRPGHKFFVITRDDVANVKREAAEAGVGAERLIVLASGRKELPGYLSICDMGLFFIRPTYSKIASSPTKHAELMGMGLPVICNDVGDTGYIIRESGTGILVEDFSEAGFAEAIAQLDSLSRLGKPYIREVASKYFDLSEGVRAYKGVYQRLFTQKPAP